MSYILKALRKSEAERAKGAVPKLTPQYEPVAPRRGSVWPWVAVAALVVNAVIGGAVLWRSDIAPWLRDMGFGPDKPVVAETLPMQPSTQGPATSQAATAAAPRAAEPTPVTEPETKAASQPVPSKPQPPMQSPAESQSAEMPDTTAKPAEMAEQQKAETVAAEPPAVSADSTAPTKSLPAEPKAVEAPDAAARIVAAIEQTPPPVASEARPKPAKAVPMAPEPPRKPAQIEDLALVFATAAEQDDPLADELPWDEEPDGTDRSLADEDPLPPEFAASQAADLFEGVPMLWQMPRSFRSRVPQMRISVHVYSPDEPGRFVIIDRKKYWEGDKLLDGVVLEAIVPDGVVMEYQGQQFRLSSR